MTYPESMFRGVRTLPLLALLATLYPALALDPDRNFTGKWNFDPRGSNTRSIPTPQEQVLTIDARESGIQCSAARQDGVSVQWTFALDGSDSRYKLGDEKRSSE